MALASKIADRWLRTGLRIDQRKGDYSNAFWKDVTLRLCKKLKVNPSKVQVMFRKRMKEHGGGVGACTGDTVIIDPNWDLESQMMTLAHELRHTYQHQSKMSECAYNDDRSELGKLWKGEWYSETALPWRKRPWEIDANKYDKVGEQLYKQMKAKGEIPLSKSDEMKQTFPFMGPILGDMDVLSDEEFSEDRRHMKQDHKGWMAKWRERYKTGWRGLKVSPDVGRVATRWLARPQGPPATEH